MDLARRIQGLLDAASWEVLQHTPGDSAEHIAALRGTPLAWGGKAILMKTDRLGFCMLAIRASDAIDNRALRHGLGIRRYRFAHADELLERTGLRPGCVPPFGRPVFDVPLYVEHALAHGERIAFTPGTPHQSLVGPTADWLRAARPEAVLQFARAKG